MRQVRAGTTPIRRLAQELGVHAETLRNWRRDARIGAYEEPGPKAPSLEEENRELRLENARLREEREILRKATAFFAKDARRHRTASHLRAGVPIYQVQCQLGHANAKLTLDVCGRCGPSAVDVQGYQELYKSDIEQSRSAAGGAK